MTPPPDLPPYQPPQYSAPEPAPAPPSRSWGGRAFALGIVAVTAATAPFLLVRSGHVDTAALFVGVPLVLAVIIALAPPAKSLHGLTFRVVTFGLLITSAFLHEGAACVLMAAPLVYGVGHLVAEIVRQARNYDARRRAALALVPLLLAASLEGTAYRVDPVQTAVTERVVAMSPAEVERSLQDGPDFSAVRPFLLRFSGYPTPTGAKGAGLTVGSGWTFTMAGGPIVTEVRSRDSRLIEFVVVSDQSKTQRWLRWERAVVRLTPQANGDTAVRLELSFTRRLDPSWYFGPIEGAMVGAGLDHFADSLGLVEVRRD
ncbi:SRPBCC family protein [Kribbella sp. NPDC056861]|uniref:SRPBCC family protein n=1 Tax=Kribbella sp. NPDC056861 TaxID=3154857 RepID=UPI003417BB0C